MKAIPKLHYMTYCLTLLVLLNMLPGIIPARAAASFDHGPFTRVLQTYVDDHGMVNYQDLRNSADRAQLESYVTSLAQADSSRMSRQEKIALYINAYNAFTLKLIVDHYPVKSIRKIPGLSGVIGLGQWSKERWVLEGRKISLNSLEHKMLRPMGDPRIHFALVCAAKSCPPLARQAYTGSSLDDMLREQGTIFNQSAKGLQTTVDKGVLGERPTLTLSRIYKWFKADFLEAADDLAGYVLPYASPEDQAFIRSHHKKLKVDYLPYDWNLNEQQ